MGHHPFQPYGDCRGPDTTAGGAWRGAGDVSRGVVRAVGVNSIVHHLDTASKGDDGAALEGFREADEIRRQLGCSWADLIADKAP